MAGRGTDEIRIRVRGEDFEESRRFIETYLAGRGVSSVIASEAVLVYEAIFDDLLENGTDPDTVLTITGQNSIGDIRIRIEFKGDRYVPGENSDPDAPESLILSAYDDKVDYSYRSGRNRIVITVRRSHGKAMIPALIGILLGVAVWTPVSIFTRLETELWLLDNIINPLEVLYGNMVLMIGGPLTFLSILKNLTETHLINDSAREANRLRLSIFYTSSISILLALGTAALVFLVTGGVDSPEGYTNFSLGMTVGEVILSLSSSNIFEPFITASPYPMLLLALLFTYALCSVGKHFDTLKTAIDACYALFSRMLSVVIFFLPLAGFVAVAEGVLGSSFARLLKGLAYAALIPVSLAVMELYYAVRLKAKSIQVVPFAGKLLPLIHENYKINSAIDAVPFNVRYCAREFGYSRAELSNTLPVLAQINLDGNCFVLTLTSMLMLFKGGMVINLPDQLLIAFLILFLSVGAPNQPGSYLIGLTIIAQYMGISGFISSAIIGEVLFGSVINMVNVIGDIVDVTIIHKIQEKSSESLSRNRTLH